MSKWMNESDHLNWKISVAHIWMGEFVQPPVPLTVHTDVIYVAFSKSLGLKNPILNTWRKKKKKPIGKAFFSQWETPSNVANIPEAQYLSDFAITPKSNKLPKSYKLLISWMYSSNCSVGFTFPAHMLVSCAEHSCACKFALWQRSTVISGLASALWSMIYDLHSLLPSLWTEVQCEATPLPTTEQAETWVLMSVTTLALYPRLTSSTSIQTAAWW